MDGMIVLCEAAASRARSNFKGGEGGVKRQQRIVMHEAHMRLCATCASVPPCSANQDGADVQWNVRVSLLRFLNEPERSASVERRFGWICHVHVAAHGPVAALNIAANLHFQPLPTCAFGARCVIDSAKGRAMLEC